MKRTLIYQIVRMALVIPMCLVAFSFASCQDDDDDSVSISDDGYEISGKIDGHYYVDLGLSVKWADRNIGASSSSDCGDYFAWGETETKDSYTTSNCITYGVEMHDIAADAEYDAATANWGSKWQMPSKDVLEELVEKCTWVWTSRNSLKGYLVTGPNGNSIFLPAAGYRSDSIDKVGENGRYWSSSPGDENYDDCHAYYLNFHDDDREVFETWRYYGRTVRPVSVSE